MSAQRKQLDPSYEEKGRISVFRLREGINSDPIFDQQIVLEPGNGGGNHYHPRTEWFSGPETLEIIWRDDQAKDHVEKLGFGVLVEIPPNTPHAVVNRGNQKAILTEWANGPLENVTEVQIVDLGA